MDGGGKIRGVAGPRSPGRPGLGPEEAEAVRALLVRVRDERFGGNATACAKALGMSQSAFSQLISRKNRPSYTTAQALATLLGVDVADVLSGAAAETAPKSIVADRYQERATALLRLRGLLPPEVVELVRSVEVHDDRPLTEIEWIELSIRYLREHERAAELAARVVVPRRT